MNDKKIIIKSSNTDKPERSALSINNDIIYLYEEDFDISGGNKSFSNKELNLLCADMYNIYRNKKYNSDGIHAFRGLPNCYPLFTSKNFSRNYNIDFKDNLDKILFESFLTITNNCVFGDSRQILVIPENIGLNYYNGLEYQYAEQIQNLLLSFGANYYKITENPYSKGLNIKYGLLCTELKNKIVNGKQ